ncbi:hypothetical protein AAFF_G00314190 [Aldrovandia affinis]|uniref:Secreted protein n=1 Tax=Aldrovandia affinis TaxID=143900 RepID=A0AAD7R7M7_9TELE|nr:hypothetical protein AAFF_G00314190 [Aldrovandia affinis]
MIDVLERFALLILALAWRVGVTAAQRALAERNAHASNAGQSAGKAQLPLYGLNKPAPFLCPGDRSRHRLPAQGALGSVTPSSHIHAPKIRPSIES